MHALRPKFAGDSPRTEVFVGDCRELLQRLPERSVDLVFADPPFNWQVPYDRWQDGMPRAEYLQFTRDWLDGCIRVLADHASLWVNIPDDTAAEIVVHLKDRGLQMVNWCIWHYRFGQNRNENFISSKVHALYFARDKGNRRWDPSLILEPTDRAAVYADKRTWDKKEGVDGLRVPLDVWYGPFWGRIQGNNKERRAQHCNQLPETYLHRVIAACSRPDDLVLDPFLGSGTTCTIARAMGRRSIGIEFSPENAASAWKRITAVGPARPLPGMKGYCPQATAEPETSNFHTHRKRPTASAARAAVAHAAALRGETPLNPAKVRRGRKQPAPAPAVFTAD